MMCTVHEFIEYGFSHDEFDASTQILREHLWRRSESQQGWRQPLAFGLLPGPRQDVLGHSHAESLKQSTVSKATIIFKTSATLLRNLLPNSQYSLEKPDTVAIAELSVESLDKMNWLGGGGYDLLALYIPNVLYKSADDIVTKGKYCPIMFENLADPILVGREELGVPKMFSDIAISRADNSCVAKISWRGAQWAELGWRNLQKPNSAPVDEPKADGSLLVHKYIPATGKSKTAQPDADHAVLIPNQLNVSSLLSKSVAKAADCKVEIDNLGCERLPTLHPIVQRLAELPILEVVEGAVTEYRGVPDLSNARRL